MTRSAESLERLDAMGIDVWVPRGTAAHLDARPAATASQESAAGPATARVRMASGDGDWLLVQDAAWDGRHERLLGDIQATIGSARCRFGQWAHSDSAGVAPDELPARGVRHVLSFGEPPDSAEPGVLIAPELEEIAKRPDARRRLWQLLAGAADD